MEQLLASSRSYSYVWRPASGRLERFGSPHPRSALHDAKARRARIAVVGDRRPAPLAESERGSRVPGGTIHLEAGGWFPSTDAKTRSSSLGTSGDLVASDEIGLDDPEVVIIGSATIRLTQRHTLRG
jgi:hypothetical protein